LKKIILEIECRMVVTRGWKEERGRRERKV
jgi:hypothetical protein